jgi:hypothetical protein
MSLSELFKGFLPESGGLHLKMNGDVFEIGCPNATPVLTIRPSDDSWIVESPEGHGHVDTPEAAAELAAQILRGDARFVTEYRGDTLSATWIEIGRGESFEVEHIASFLCPFDAEDWELAPGEQWRQVRVTRNYLPESATIAEGKAERVAEDSMAKTPSLMTALERGLGPPEPGMRWTLGTDNRLVLQAPKGWRRHLRNRETRFVEFIPPGGGFVFRSRHYFRDSERPLATPITTAVSPNSITHAEGGTDPNWNQQTWTLMFTDGENDMMAIFDLFYLPKLAAEAEAIRDQISAAAPLALFVPLTWDMRRPPRQLTG